MVPLVVVEENELGIVACGVGVFDFDGLSDTNRQDVRNESAIDIIENRLGARSILERRMDLIARELRLLTIDHEDHVGDSFGAAVDDQAFRRDLLLGTKRIGVGIDGCSGGDCPIENELDRHIGPLLRDSKRCRSETRQKGDREGILHRMHLRFSWDKRFELEIRCRESHDCHRDRSSRRGLTQSLLRPRFGSPEGPHLE